MRFYTQQHKHYCGVDLHARSMYLCVIDHDAEVFLHRNLPARPEPFLDAKIHDPNAFYVLSTVHGIGDILNRCLVQDRRCARIRK